MSKIIKHGNTITEYTCPKCFCIFQTTKADIKTGYRNTGGFSDYPFDNAYYDYVSCPECNASIIFNDTEEDYIKQRESD